MDFEHRLARFLLVLACCLALIFGTMFVTLQFIANKPPTLISEWYICGTMRDGKHVEGVLRWDQAIRYGVSKCRPGANTIDLHTGERTP